MKTEVTIGPDRAGRIKAILASKGLTLRQVSLASEGLYGSNSAYRIPHNLYSTVAHVDGFIPSLQQLCAFSSITGYRLDDWLRVFEIELARIPQLQALLPAKRTVLIDSSLDRCDAALAWLRDAQETSSTDEIVPLGLLVASNINSKYPKSPMPESRQKCLFAKIGLEDALAFPDLLPGSIVRVIPCDSDRPRPEQRGQIFLIQHSRGTWCSRLHFSDGGRIQTASNQLAFAPVEFRIPSEARILGIVDMEIRWLTHFAEPRVPAEFSRHWPPEEMPRSQRRLGEFLRRARMRAGLSFREASALSRRVSEILGDEHYFAASGSLSDYEAQHTPPRQVQKVLTLCIVYGVSFLDFLETMEVEVDKLGRDPVPQPLMCDQRCTAQDEAFAVQERQDRNPLLAALTAQFGELPHFLRASIADLSGIRNLSLRDFFWLGAKSELMASYFGEALLVLVNRHRQKPLRLRSKPLWQQPAYVLRMRDGKYICAGCSLENDMLMLYPETPDIMHPMHLQNRRDAEVVGQITAMARRIR